jgi:hypothetical protein
MKRSRYQPAVIVAATLRLERLLTRGDTLFTVVVRGNDRGDWLRLAVPKLGEDKRHYVLDPTRDVGIVLGLKVVQGKSGHANSLPLSDSDRSRARNAEIYVDRKEFSSPKKLVETLSTLFFRTPHSLLQEVL